MSASKMRAAALSGDIESFRSGVPTTLNHTYMLTLLKLVVDGMTT